MSVHCGKCGTAMPRAWADSNEPCPRCEETREARRAIALLAQGQPFKVLVVTKAFVGLNSVSVASTVAEFATREQADAAFDAVSAENHDEWTNTKFKAVKLYTEKEPM